MITELRYELLTALSELDDVKVETSFERVQPPGIVVRPALAGSYLTYPDEPVLQGTFVMSVDVYLVVRNGDKALDELEALIERVIGIIRDTEWNIESVSEYGLAPIQSDYPSLIVRLTRELTL